ncbi:MAG: 5-formyltetrahydrofolate cyclo-ligase [Paramuribaculum sp.]|nr:5-formyltetrahydrofolate cyclo-ligase [Paramuribaculum sp.]
MNKDQIRRRVKARKSLLDDNERLRAAESVFERLQQLAAFAVSNHILAYHSLPDELSTLAFLNRWHGTKNLYLPRVNGVNLDILPYNPANLRIGAFHIDEPTGTDTTDVDTIEMIIVPAVAYDAHGNRVGRGRGFYDRLLQSTRALKVGVGYDFQLVDEIDAEPHDVPVDIVITESRTIITRRSKR